MKSWLRKAFIALVSIVTFGTVTPSHAVWANDQDTTKSQERGTSITTSPKVEIETIIETENLVEISEKDQFIQAMKLAAKEQSIEKFGTKISNVIEHEFEEIILPKIEETIETIAHQFPEEDLKNLTITESPAGGFGEKIFHIYNSMTNEDIIRFHVRRDHPPLEGYTFNFHYHTYHDQFQTHYTLGNIDWNKNTPPKWKTN